jgi:membrane protease YdiL (CAAX protease family)
MHDPALADAAAAERLRLAPYLLGLYAAWAVWALLLFPRMSAWAPSPGAERAISALVVLAVWLLPVVLLVRWAGHPRPVRFLRLRGGVRRGPTLAVAAGAAVWLAGAQAVGFGTVADLPGVLLLGWLTAPVAEEIVFRGLVLGTLVHRMATGWAVVVSAALFVVPHLPPWLAHRPLDLALVADVFGVLVLGIVLGAIVRWTGSLWPAMVAHYVANVASALVGL